MGQTSIITLDDAVSQLPLQHSQFVLSGGCFDILHPGHIAFLKACQKVGDTLLLVLESDKKITELKGKDRPYNNQKTRAKNLASLNLIDYIILLPYFSENNQYDKMIYSLKPAIIATTFGDPYRFHKERQAESVGAKVIDVIERLSDYSTTKLLTKHE